MATALSVRSGRRPLPLTPVLIALLAAPPAALGAEGATLELFHGPDDAGSMKLKTLRMVLDGRDLQVVPADPERALFSATVAPGVHDLEVEALLENDGAFFSYMDGYRLKMRSRLQVEVIAGEGIAIRSRILPRGELTAPWQERNKLVLTLSAKGDRGAPAVAASAAPLPAPPAAPEAVPGEPATAAAERAPAEPVGAPPPAAAPGAAREPEATQAVAAPTARVATTTARPAAREPAPRVAKVEAAPIPERAPAPAAPAPAPRAAKVEAAPIPERAPAPAAPEPAPRAAKVEAAPIPERAPTPPARERSAPTRIAKAAPPAEAPAPAALPAGPCEIPPLSFAFGSAALTAEARAALDGLAACAAASSLRVRVEGHTDARGGDEFNRWLAWDRAAAAAAWLRERGLAHRLVTTRFVGKGRPLCQEATEACHARNRRVEVITLP